MTKKTLNIDFNQLCEALDDSSYEHKHYLDLKTGEILFVSEYDDDKETKKLRQRMEEDSDRYEPIPRAESDEGYEDMEAFIAMVENEHLAEILQVAINGRGAFRRFKDVLFNYPEEREKWFHFKDERIKQRAREWLNNIDVALDEE